MFLLFTELFYTFKFLFLGGTVAYLGYFAALIKLDSICTMLASQQIREILSRCLERAGELFYRVRCVPLGGDGSIPNSLLYLDTKSTEFSGLKMQHRMLSQKTVLKNLKRIANDLTSCCIFNDNCSTKMPITFGILNSTCYFFVFW